MPDWQKVANVLGQFASREGGCLGICILTSIPGDAHAGGPWTTCAYITVAGV